MCYIYHSKHPPTSHSMHPVYISALLLLSLGIGIYLGLSKYSWSLTLLAFSTLVIVFRLILLRFPGLEYQIFSFDSYALIRPWWGFMVGLFVMGAAAFNVKHFACRVLSKAAIGVILLISMSQLISAAGTDHSSLMSNYPNPTTGWVEQQTRYTCGPASASMLLYNQFGIAASEGEMANLCGSTAASGSDEFSVRRALRSRLEGFSKEVNLSYLKKSEFSSVRTPCMAVINIAYQLDHWVVVTEITPHSVTYLDPTHGYKMVSREKFVKDWKQVVIEIEDKQKHTQSLATN